MRIDQVKATTTRISVQFRRDMVMANTLDALKVTLRRWRDFTADARDIVTTWTLEDFDTFLHVVRFNPLVPGATPITTGICDEATYKACVAVMAPELLSLMVILSQRDKIPEGRVVKALMAQGILHQVDNQWRVVIQSPSPEDVAAQAAAAHQVAIANAVRIGRP